MTIPAMLPVSSLHQSPSNRQTVSILAVAPTLSQTPVEAGATVYVAGTPGNAQSPSVWRTTADVQSSVYPAHVVKIRINPQFDNSRVISTVRLSPDDNTQYLHIDKDHDLVNDARVIERNMVNGKGLDCVRISVNDVDQDLKKTDMVQKEEMNRACFYYGAFQNGISTMVMSSGQCSPSDTLDSGTCSDLDGTPPPLPKKKSSSTVMLGDASAHTRTGSLTSSGAEVDSDDNESSISCDSLNSGDLVNGSIVIQDPSKSVVKTSRDLEGTVGELERICLNNNHEEVNKNYDSELIVNDGSSELIVNDGSSELIVNDGSTELIVNERLNDESIISPTQSGTSSLSKSSSTPRVRSPNPLANGRQHASPVVKECTYEERKREQDRIEMENAAAEHYANYKRDNGSKYVYEDDRFYEFHVNELVGEGVAVRKGRDEGEGEEFFAGYKILDREAIRSAKGTVRGVKNRVRAGIATFLQNPSSKVSGLFFYGLSIIGRDKRSLNGWESREIIYLEKLSSLKFHFILVCREREIRKQLLRNEQGWLL